MPRGLRGFIGGWAFSYERGTAVTDRALSARCCRMLRRRGGGAAQRQRKTRARIQTREEMRQTREEIRQRREEIRQTRAEIRQTREGGGRTHGAQRQTRRQRCGKRCYALSGVAARETPREVFFHSPVSLYPRRSNLAAESLHSVALLSPKCRTTPTGRGRGGTGEEHISELPFAIFPCACPSLAVFIPHFLTLPILQQVKGLRQARRTPGAR